MYRPGNRHKSIIISILLGISLIIARFSVAALLPEYERLQPITTNLTAPTAVAIDKYECVFVAESTKNILNIYSQGGEYIKSLTGLEKPISVAVADNDRIYIGNKNTGNVEVYDENLSLLFKLGIGNGEFAQPGAIKIDSDGYVYVADSKGDQIRVYNDDGSINFVFGSTGGADGEFNFPSSIDIDETAGEIIVVDRQLILVSGSQIAGARIQVFDMNGVFKRSFGNYGVGEGLMAIPTGVAVDGEGRIYVADALQHVVHIFDGSDGTFLGTIYDVDNPMRTPLDITFGGSNRLFIASLNSQRVEVYGISDYTNMQITPLSLSFEGEAGGSSPALQSLTISNNGSGTLNWTADTDNNWISLSAASGSVAVSGTSNLNIGVSLVGLSEGTYTGYVVVSSGTPAAEVITVTLTVSEAVQLTADAGGPYSGIEGQAVQFDGSNSGGVVSLYEWDVDNNGSYDYRSSSPTQNHTYTMNGAYTVKLRITYAGNKTSEATATATISDTSPTAAFSATPTTGSGPLTVTFVNGSTGFDQSLTYAWDFDCDGNTDSTLENPSHIFTTEGNYIVLLTVTDSDGSTDTLMKTNYIYVTASSEIAECSNYPVKKGLYYHSTLESAYNAANYGEVIKLHKQEINAPSLSIGRDVTITIDGGYNCSFTGKEGKSTINGNLTVTTGTLIIGDIILE